MYSITGIELTLYWNGVGGVYDVNSTGQLIPLTIGLCGLVQTLYVLTIEVGSFAYHTVAYTVLTVEVVHEKVWQWLDSCSTG